MILRRRQLHRWALRVLFVWLFGLGLGVANACLAAAQFESEPSTLLPTAVASGIAPDAMPEGCVHHAVPGVSQGGGESQSSKSNCESFCERASVSIPPQTSMLGDLQAHAHALAAVALGSVLPAPVNTPVLRWERRRDGVRPQPILITFLRLAL